MLQFLGVVWMCWTGNNPMPSAPSQAIPVHVLNVLLGFQRGSAICDLSEASAPSAVYADSQEERWLVGVSPGLTGSHQV